MSALCLSALRSLDDCLALVCGSLEKLKAAKSVDIAEVIGQLKVVAESARVVREWVWSELPQASWQSREELDALIHKIEESLAARSLEQLRFRLLALATELEDGSIVHRRALRVNELNRLREQAITELRSQAGLEAGTQTLPGPQADRWIEWACGLREPQDAESLQTLRSGFAYLDDFVANLEPNMWVAGPPGLEIPPEPETPAGKAPAEQSLLETNGFHRPLASLEHVQIELESPKSLEGLDGRRFPDLLDELPSRVLESNTLTPNDATPPRTEEEVRGILAQERALLDGLMGLVRDPVGHFNRPVESPVTAEVFREAHPARASLVSVPVGEVGHTGESAVTAEVFRETNVPVAIHSDIRIADEKRFGRKWRMSLGIPAVLVFAALLLSVVLGAIRMKSNRNGTGNGLAKTIERIPEQARSNPDDKGHGQSGTAAAAATHTSSPTTQIEKPPKRQDQSVTSKAVSLPLPLPKKSANDRDNGGSRPVVATPRNIAMVKSEEVIPNGTAERPDSIPGGLPSGLPNGVANIVKNVPVAVPKVAVQNVRISSGVAQGLLVHQVTPRYPQQARQARVHGTVVLQAIIGKDGTVQNLHVVSGPPMLLQAALDAVKQWRYKPYYLNGEPVEADTQINVNFTLSGE